MYPPAHMQKVNRSWPPLGDERVVGVAEQLLVVLVPRAELHRVHDLLRVFDAHAELERLRRHRHAAVGEHSVGVAGAVADRQHDHRRWE